ncbi:MAG: hypothetical protein B6229_02210 [Spirochaetaceae bacterium 4572_7]|nr:MAG: hypothetical protein B6229_02210 [Spirochaetaceae bacterium 4572_7]
MSKYFDIITMLLLALTINLFAIDEFPGHTLDFDGSEYVEVPYSQSLNPSVSFEISFWAKVEGGEGTY